MIEKPINYTLFYCRWVRTFADKGKNKNVRLVFVF